MGNAGRTLGHAEMGARAAEAGFGPNLLRQASAVICSSRFEQILGLPQQENNMSASPCRILGLVWPFCLLVACSEAKKIDIGGVCTLNSDCNSPLVCTMNKCHEACRVTIDCPAEQSCVKMGGVGVCQLPAETPCAASVPCGPLLICASDLRCRSACSSAANCTDGQVCVQSVCADTKDLGADGKLPQQGGGALDSGAGSQGDGGTGDDANSMTDSTSAVDGGRDSGPPDSTESGWAAEAGDLGKADANDTPDADIPDVPVADGGAGDEVGSQEAPDGNDDFRGVDGAGETASTGFIWYVNQTATSGGDGKSWSTAFPSLQTALLNGKVRAGDQIWVAEGIYAPAASGANRSSCFYLLTGVALYGGFHGVESQLTERDNPVDPGITVLSGDLSGNDGVDASGAPSNRDDNTYHVVVGAMRAVLDGFTLTGGNANGTTSEQQAGGGMYCQQCDGARIANVVITGNAATGSGGGMYAMPGADAVMKLANVAFANNTAGDSGGGMYNGSGNAVLVNTVFEQNAATNGGGMETSGSSPTLVNALFVTNSCSSTGLGGGMSTSGSPILINATFANNSGGYGGGIGRSWASGGKLTLTNVTLVGNSGPQGGGAICYGAGDYVNVVARNNSQPGSDVASYGETSISHSDIQGCNSSGSEWATTCGTDLGGNIDTSSNQFDSYRAPSGSWTSTPSYSAKTSRTTFTNASTSWEPGELVGMFIQPDTSNSRWLSIAANTATTLMVWGDVASSAANGAMYQIRTLRLASGSQCIDKGDNSALPADTQDLDGDGNISEILPMDLVGGSRVVNGTVDMGSYEYQ
jgi:hypothetical protein